MSSSDITVPESYYLDGLSKITHEIVEKSANGNYIYRGEPEHYEEEPYFGKVSTALYRIAPQGYDSGQYNLERVQKETLDEARKHIREYSREDFEILTELQHFGNPTNLLDFTTDYNLALFFACDGSHDKDGRIILLKRTKEINDKYRIKEPQNPQNRVIAQKSIFVRPVTGYIDPDDIVTITVPKNLKQWILIHLWKFQDISTQSIYNDLHGFIRHSNLRSSEKAISPRVFADWALERLTDEDQTIEERKEQLQGAIRDYTTAIQYSPYDATIYVKQGRCYNEKQEFELAIETFSKAIFLNPNYAHAYFCRGWVYREKRENAHAIADFSKAINLASDFANAYFNRGLSYATTSEYGLAIEDFTKAIELKPDDASAHFACGMMRLHVEDWEQAKSDLLKAKNKGCNVSASFRKMHPNAGDFKGQNGSKLPDDIAAMLYSN